jgi:hypothetical protein
MIQSAPRQWTLQPLWPRVSHKDTRNSGGGPHPGSRSFTMFFYIFHFFPHQLISVDQNLDPSMTVPGSLKHLISPRARNHRGSRDTPTSAWWRSCDHDPGGFQKSYRKLLSSRLENHQVMRFWCFNTFILWATKWIDVNRELPKESFSMWQHVTAQATSSWVRTFWTTVSINIAELHLAGRSTDMYVVSLVTDFLGLKVSTFW